MDFNYNSNDVLLLNYNGNEVKNLYYNGAQVYQKRTLTLSLTFTYKENGGSSSPTHFVIPTLVVTVNGKTYQIAQSDYSISTSNNKITATLTYSIPVVNNSSINISFSNFTQLSYYDEGYFNYYQGSTYAGSFFSVYYTTGLNNVKFTGTNSDDTTISIKWNASYVSSEAYPYYIDTYIYYSPSTLTISNV